MEQINTFNPTAATETVNEAMVLVQNKADEPRLWQADGKLVTLAPKGQKDAVQWMPRWVYQLGLKQPGYSDQEGRPGIAQVAPGDTDKAFEQEQKARLEADIAASKKAIADSEKRLKELQKQLAPEVPAEPVKDPKK